MKNKKTVKNFFKRNRTVVVLLVILLFPIVIGLFYALPVPQIVAVDSGDLLAYYGTAFGIIGSFITYRHELKKSQKEKNKELRPTFMVAVNKIDEKYDIFVVDIINRSQQTITYLYFYDEFVSAVIEDKYSFRTTFNKSKMETENINPDYNITMDFEILDTDGFPKYVQLVCDDSERNCWNCCYHKVRDNNKVYYYPDDFEIV